MQYVNVGTSGLKMSRLALGTARFGEIDDDAAFSVVDAALNLGINAFDTADAYNQGASEETLGRSLKGRRDQVVLCSKVGLRVGETEQELAASFRPGSRDHFARWRHGIAPTDGGLSRIHIAHAVEASLRRLSTDRIDLYQVHRFDHEVPLEETLSALDDLVRSGKVRYLGCSGFAAWQLTRAHWLSERDRTARFVSIQSAYNLLHRDIERELVPACDELGVGILAFQVLAGGMLTGRFGRHDEPDATTRIGSRNVYRARYWNDRVFDVVERLETVAQDAGRLVSHLAIGWALSNRAIAAVLLGASTPRQLDDLRPLLDRALTADEVHAVDECAYGMQDGSAPDR